MSFLQLFRSTKGGQPAFQPSIEQRNGQATSDLLGNWDIDLKTNKVVLSGKICRIFGISVREHLDSSELLEDFIHPDDKAIVKERLSEAMNKGIPYNLIHRLLLSDDSVRTVHALGDLFYDQNGEPAHFIGTLLDMTEPGSDNHPTGKNEPVHASSASPMPDPAYTETLINAIPDFIQFKDGEGRWLKANAFALSLFQLDDDSYAGKNDDEIAEHYSISPESLSKCSSTDEQVWESSRLTRYEDRITAPNGQTSVYDMVKVPIFNSDGSRKGLVTVGRDITERKQAEQLSQYLAYHDPLTELPNRSSFKDELHQALSVEGGRQQKLAVIYLDMDRFKYINDSLGHSVGDRLLKQIADRLAECVQEKGTLYRLGGDEFAVLLPYVLALNDAVDIAKQIIKSIDHMFIVDEYELYLTTSAGISLYPNDGEDAQSLMKYADTALYRAKEQGKNNYQIYHSSMNIQTYKIFLLEKDLRRALLRDEFELYYQPRLDANTGRIVGMEALIRWNHPEWGLVSPDEFIPLAEETGLIIYIGEWVIEAACRQNKAWQEQGLPSVSVSVNISAHQFMRKDFIHHMNRIIAETDINPHWLEIEITENILMDNDQSTILTMQNLQKMGISISLDDFGTGYSSLSYLKHFKVDTIKIDKSFIRDLRVDSESYFIIKSIIQLVKSLHILVAAEGVEQEEQLHILRRMNCDQVQGYLYSKPVPAAKMGELLKRGTLHYHSSLEEGERLFDNQRQFFRVPFPFGLSSDMTIIQIRDKRLELGKTEVIIEDIGLGGLRFLSVVKLPVNHEIIIEFATEIVGKMLTFHGFIVWQHELEDQLFQYGFEFQITEPEQSALARLLNELTVQLRKSPLPPNSRWVQTDKLKYLKCNQSQKEATERT
ncbi:EAL domain-containing protein [Paenibacillus alkaliterrae]|uniref:EAL domain-containing protein n=1 Tax=Paenibacillus alkaliterrae TaxID=320909 RepID=UPI001F34EBD6|nr:EAL domain-containing protein [Paenibacillus alkaliterrae]MCF2938072.1 EAL domain-containing protein [Paenibacillus alkaliterrae]